MKPGVVGAAILLLFGASGARAAEPGLDARIVKLLERVSAERLQQTIERLVSFETRNTLSSAGSPSRGIGAARQWILAELASYSPKLQVSFDGYQVAGVAALSALGHESVVSAYVNPQRPAAEIKTK